MWWRTLTWYDFKITENTKCHDMLWIHFIIHNKRTTIWSWGGGGGGGLANLVGTDSLFSSRARPENLFPGKPRTEYLFSTKEVFEKAKRKGGIVRGLGKDGRTWLQNIEMFCRLLARYLAYLVAWMFWYWFFSVFSRWWPVQVWVAATELTELPQRHR